MKHLTLAVVIGALSTSATAATYDLPFKGQNFGDHEKIHTFDHAQNYSQTYKSGKMCNDEFHHYTAFIKHKNKCTDGNAIYNLWRSIKIITAAVFCKFRNKLGNKPLYSYRKCRNHLPDYGWFWLHAY